MTPGNRFRYNQVMATSSGLTSDNASGAIDLTGENVHWDLREAMSYADYLHLPELLACQRPLTRPDITVVATPRSGGALNLYGALKGDKVYTIYIETGLGTAVMQFADPTSAAHAYSGDLTAPEPMRAEVPSDLQRSRLVIACILDRSGLLRNAQVLEPGGSEMTGKVLASLPNWKFRPVLRGDQPVEVNAILGFNIDTR